MNRPRRLAPPLVVLVLAAAGAFFSAFQVAVVAASCENNFTGIGDVGSGLTRETDGTVVRCHYTDVPGGDVDFVISATPAVITMLLTAAIALVALVQVIGVLRDRDRGR